MITNVSGIVTVYMTVSELSHQA